jgi:uncharacterized membrane protein YdjX (TVP38/TMEM64 family)
VNKKIKSILKVVFIVVILTIVLQWLLPAMTSEEFQNFVSRVGVIGPVIVISYIVLSHVIAPLTGSPGVILGWAVYGVVKGSIFHYVASMISAAINFWIARKFGRKWVTKLVGKPQMKEVDEFVSASGEKILVVSRIFGWTLFELISYAAGLTNISFRKYFTITLLFSSIPSVLFVLLFKDTDFTKPANTIIWISGLVITGIIFAFLMKKYIKKNNAKKQ